MTLLDDKFNLSKILLLTMWLEPLRAHGKQKIHSFPHRTYKIVEKTGTTCKRCLETTKIFLDF